MAVNRPAPAQADIDERFRIEFEVARSIRDRARLVALHVAQFPEHAFRPSAWFFAQWQQWRADPDYGEHRALLRAVGRGVQEPFVAYLAGWRVAGPTTSGRAVNFRQLSIAHARETFSRVMSDQRLRTLYNDLRRLRRRQSAKSELVTRSKAIVGHATQVLGIETVDRPGPLGSRTAQRKAYGPLQQEFLRGLMKGRALSRECARFVAKIHKVRERDLH